MIRSRNLFSNEPSSLHFTSKGGLDKMPDESGNILSDGTNFGVYIGGVAKWFFASKESGCVTKDTVSNGTWNAWSSISGATYNNTEHFFLRNMTKRKRIIWDWCSGRFRLTKTAGDTFTALTATS